MQAQACFSVPLCFVQHLLEEHLGVVQCPCLPGGVEAGRGELCSGCMVCLACRAATCVLHAH